MNETRQKLLQTLAELSEADPELRFGQMIINVVNLGMGRSPGSVWDCEDDDMIEAANYLIEILNRRRLAVA